MDVGLVFCEYYEAQKGLKFLVLGARGGLWA